MPVYVSHVPVSVNLHFLGGKKTQRTQGRLNREGCAVQTWTQDSGMEQDTQQRVRVLELTCQVKVSGSSLSQ